MHTSIISQMNLICPSGLNVIAADALSDELNALLVRFKEEKQSLVTFREMMISNGFQHLNHYFHANGVNVIVSQSDLNQKHAFELLKRNFWRQAVRMTNVMVVMPAKLKQRWEEQFEEGHQRITVDDRVDVKKYVGIPEFDESTVIPTLTGLLKDRHQYFCERVTGVFNALSKSHLTNKPFGFSSKLILANVMDENEQVRTLQANYIEDLRVIIAFFHGHHNPEFSANKRLISDLFRTTGEWNAIDGGAILVKSFKNGNLHLRIHPDLAWRMNLILAENMSNIIPSVLRKPEQKRPKEFMVLTKTLLPAVCENLHSLICEAKIKRCGEGFRVWTTSEFWRAHNETINCLSALGGVINTGGFTVDFDYNPTEVIRYVAFVGILPEKVSHQFYPSPEVISRVVDDLLEYEEGEEICEPSAGRGDLLKFINADASDITVVEISKLYCRLLKEKYSNVINADFLQWASLAPRFDRIVMNPPFSDGRAEAHLLAASRLIRKRLVAVLPASLKGKKLLGEQFRETWFDNEYTNVFEGTGVTVAIIVVEPIPS